MKSINRKRDSIVKILLLICFFLAPSISSAEINSKQWNKICDKDGKNCYIAIKFETDFINGKKKTIATAYIRTAKKSEKNFAVVLFVNFPLNIDLTRNPLVIINKQNITTMDFTHCNRDIGCASSSILTSEALKFFKAGRNMEIIFGVNGANKDYISNFSLKGFTKSFDSLIK